MAGTLKHPAGKLTPGGKLVIDPAHDLLRSERHPLEIQAGSGDVLTEHSKAMEKSIPMQRVGRPDEVADAVLWLCQRRRELRDRQP